MGRVTPPLLLNPKQMTEVKWIKSQDGTEYPIRFNMTVYYQLAKEYKIATNNVVKFMNSIETWDIDQTYKFYLYAFQSGARKVGKEFSMDEMAFIDWLFDDENLLEQVGKAFVESMTDGSDQGAKKKGAAPK